MDRASSITTRTTRANDLVMIGADMICRPVVTVDQGDDAAVLASLKFSFQKDRNYIFTRQSTKIQRTMLISCGLEFSRPTTPKY